MIDTPYELSNAVQKGLYYTNATRHRTNRRNAHKNVFT